MKVSQLLKPLTFTCPLFMVFSQPVLANESGKVAIFSQVKAESNPLNRAIDLLGQAPSPALIQITGVKLNPIANGLEVLLESNGKALPLTRIEGNTVLAEVQNAVLALPEGPGFQTANPAPGIASVSVMQIDTTTVRVSVVGTETAPTAIVRVSEPIAVEPAALDTTDESEEGEEEIVATGDLTPNYRVPNASTATGTDTPILETPFSVQVVPKEVIRDQQATRIEEVLRNVSGVNTTGSDAGRQANFNIRGFGGNFGARTPLLRDGFRVYGSFQSIPEVGNLEQVEVLKGPSSILYGAIEPGGIINLVSKKPLAKPFYELELQAGSRDLVRPRIDFNGPLTEDGTVLGRLSALYKHEDNFRGFDTASDRIAISPALTWKIGDRTKVDFSLEYIHDHGPADFGITQFRRGVAPIPIDRPLNNPDDTITTDYLSLGYRFEHQLNDNWTIRNAFRYIRYAYDYSVLALPFIVDGANVTRFYADQDGQSNSYSLYTSVVGKFTTGSVKHTLTAGIDLNHSTDRITTLFDINNPSSINIFNPNYDLVPKPPRSELPLFGDTNVISDRLGIYLQDQINLLDNLTLVAGIRYDAITQTTTNVETDFTDAGRSTQSDNAFTPRIGLLYKPISEVTLFGNYAQSFNPSTATNRGIPLKPERGEGFEFGVKTELLNQRLLATLTYFNITKNNVGVADPANPLNSISIGQQKSQGIEFDIAGEILPGWKIVGSYAYTDAQVSEDKLNPSNVGNQFSSVPRHSINLWTTYEIQKGVLQGLGFGVGFNYVGDRFGDLANTFKLGDYLIGNAAIFYNRDRYRFALNFKNISNAYYIESSTGNDGGIEPGAPFTVIGSFSVKF